MGLTPRLFSATETGELIVAHRSVSATLLRSIGVLALTVTPVLVPIGLLLLKLPEGCGIQAVVAMGMLMLLGLPLSAYSPYFRIYDGGFQPYRKPLRYAFWGYFIPWEQVASVRVIDEGEAWEVRTTEGARHRTSMEALEVDQLRFLLTKLDLEVPAGRVDQAGWPSRARRQRAAQPGDSEE